MAGFIDESQLHARAGDGGAGAVSFRREAHVARGGPDGGDGGSGGDVVLEASSAVSSLLGFRDHPHRAAEHGGHGAGARRHGRSGADLVVAVPEGTIVSDLEGAVLADLAQHGDVLVAARGGRGGKGNASFLTNRLRAPAFAEQGERGEERWLNLELKLFADVALVGFPNVGKSTLISTVSAAKPKIADYPFTTLEPHLGVVALGDRNDAFEFVLADVPGLVEGASDGRGLGHRFLRHVERARVLLLLADLSFDAELSPRAQVEALLNELGRHEPALLERPRVIAGSRSDLRQSDALGDELIECEISARTGEGVRALVNRLARLVEEARATAPRRQTRPMLFRPEPEGFTIAREGATFVVEGREAVRAVALSDLTDEAALDLAHRRLKRLGVDRALHRAGARDGDTVTIGSLSFTYSEEL